MSLNECASCSHTNPADAKFCNACGVALPLPLPQADDPTSGFRSSVRFARDGQAASVLASAGSSTGVAAALAQADPLADPLEPIAYAVQFDPDQTVRIGCVFGAEGLNAAANSDFDPAGADSPRLGLSAAQPLALAGPMGEMGMPGADIAPGPGDTSVALRMWKRWPGAVIIGASASVAMLAFAYFGFLQYSAPDISWPAAGNSDVSARTESADRSGAARFGMGGISEAAPLLPSGAVDATAPLNSETKPETAARPQFGATPVLPVTEARGIPTDALAPRPVAGVVQPRVAARAVALRPQSTARNDALSRQAAAAGAATVARTSAQSTGSAAPAARIGPCTDAVAALGLCTPDPTQRKP